MMHAANHQGDMTEEFRHPGYTMTVADLIEVLQRLDPEATVVFTIEDRPEWHRAYIVKQTKASRWIEDDSDLGTFEEDPTGECDVVLITG
jgi:hypothetical protein